MQSVNHMQSETARPTIPQTMFDRFQSEWQQMRTNAPAPQTPSKSSDAKA